MRYRVLQEHDRRSPIRLRCRALAVSAAGYSAWRVRPQSARSVSAQIKNFEVTHDFESIGRRTMVLHARRMNSEPAIEERIVLVLENITGRKALQERLRLFTIGLEAQVEDRTRDLVQSQDRLRAMATELKLAEQRERKRLAMELHDHLQQTLVLGRIVVGQGMRVSSAVPATLDVLKKLDRNSMTSSRRRSPTRAS